MNTALVRSTTLRLSRRPLDIGYGYFNPAQRSIREDAAAGDGNQPRSKFSLRRSLRVVHPMMTTATSYKRDRAQKRHIFLQSYRLSSLNSSRKAKSPPRKLKKAAIKVKSLVVSVLSFVREVSVKSFNRRSAIAAAPTSSSRVQTWF